METSETITGLKQLDVGTSLTLHDMMYIRSAIELLSSMQTKSDYYLRFITGLLKTYKICILCANEECKDKEYAPKESECNPIFSISNIY